MEKEDKKLTVSKAQELLEIKITADDIVKYFCPLATQKEIFMALGIIKSLKLNPFTHEVHLIKYDQRNPLDIVVGYEVYLKRAERTGKLDGWQCDINKEKNVAWIKIWRKDWKEPFYWEVNLNEFDKGQATWKSIPTFMGKKVAIAQGFRLAFPDELGGMPYIKEEIEVYDIHEGGISTKPDVEIPKAIEDKEIPLQQEPPKEIEKTNVYKQILDNFAKAKKKVGEDIYYKVLGNFGLEHCNQIKKIDEGLKILEEMRIEYERNKTK